jgi:uncharacterized protein (TIGR00725 family)
VTTRNHEEKNRNFPRLAVGVMGSAGGDIAAEVIERMERFGEEVARRGYALITGAAPGIPHAAVIGACRESGFVVGISPALNFREHVERYNSPTYGYDVMVYTGSGLMGREIENIRTCDVVVIAGGRSGTLGEFAIAYDEAKVIGVLGESGGIADHIEEITRLVDKDTGATVISDPDPIKLLDLLENEYEKRVLPQYLELIQNHNPHGKVEE